MRHHIIVKFNEQATDKAALLEEVTVLFAESTSIPGVHGYSVHPNVVARSNRYDMMIIMDMDKEALAAYDVSEPHLRWKSVYGNVVEKKAIFDCDD